VPKFLFTLSEPQHRRLKELAADAGLPAAEIVRRAVDAYGGARTPCALLLSGGACLSGHAVVVRVG